jgi:hypothetical protein
LAGFCFNKEWRNCDDCRDKEQHDYSFVFHIAIISRRYEGAR